MKYYCPPKLIPYIFFPIFLNIITNSLNSGQVSPFLKKQNLDPNSISKYHPISDLSLLSKILERIVSKQCIAHINNNTIFDTFQRAFRKGHSTVTSPLRVTAVHSHDTMLSTFNSNTCFRKMEHTILISRLTMMDI